MQPRQQRDRSDRGPHGEPSEEPDGKQARICHTAVSSDQLTGRRFRHEDGNALQDLELGAGG